MVESNVTRRRVLAGAGAVGVATFGSTAISAQEGGGQDVQGAAIRVVHASPDAPAVDVRLTGQDAGLATGGGNQTGGNQTGNATGGGQGDDAPTIEGLSFGNVSNYTEVDPGSYQVQIVPGESGLIEGVVEDVFGGGGDEETVLFEEQLDVEQGTTYTLVAFGSVAQGQIPAEGTETGGGIAGNETGGLETDGNVTTAGQNETDGLGMDGNATAAGQNETAGAEADGAATGGDVLIPSLSYGEYQTVEVEAGDYTLEFRETDGAGAVPSPEGGAVGNETDGLGQDGTDGVGGNETGGAGVGTSPQGDGAGQGFQVAVLEDDLTAPGEGTARFRVFHAVPDVGTMSIARVSGGEAGGAGGQNATGGAAGQNDTGAGLGPGNETEGMGAGQNETEDVGADDVAEQEGVRRASFSVDGNTAYSGFAMGYFDPQAAATGGGQGNETGGLGAGQGGDGNATGNATSGEQVAQDDEVEEFQFVTVTDAEGGERADGGTGGILDLARPADD